MSDESQHHRRALLQQLESLQASGVEFLPRATAPLRPAAIPSASADPQEPTNVGVVPSQALPTKPAVAEVSSAPSLEVLQQEVANCRLCQELAETRKQTVFGVGNPQARLCFLGEAPGADEDRLGEPFVGRAGQLLNKIIEACKLRREDVYILNILKCRPPGNRNPTTIESDHCRRFLLRQLELIDPEFLCCLGAVAAQNLLETTTPIGRLRGKTHDYRGISVVCTYHPAYLLRNPAAKKETWEDMKMLMRLMGIDL